MRQKRAIPEVRIINDLDRQQQLQDTIKEQIRSTFLRVEKLESQLGYSTDFLPPVDPNDTDALLASLAQRVIWLEQFSGERPCPRA